MNLNRRPIYSKLSEALRSSFLGHRGGRHAVEQLHLARSKQGPHMACSKWTGVGNDSLIHIRSSDSDQLYFDLPVHANINTLQKYKLYLPSKEAETHKGKDILNLHHHVGDMVDRAALHNVPSTFPEVWNDTSPKDNVYRCSLFFIYAFWVRAQWKSVQNQTLGRADNQKCSRPQRYHESMISKYNYLIKAIVSLSIYLQRHHHKQWTRHQRTPTRLCMLGELAPWSWIWVRGRFEANIGLWMNE